MRKKTALFGLALIAVAISGILLWNYFGYLDETRHETNRWAVIQDVNGDRMAVEPTSDEAWNQLLELNRNKITKWVGGIVERYRNKWGFRFKPETIIVAEVTAEGLQATIRYISGNLDYWLGGYAYVGAKATETHMR